MKTTGRSAETTRYEAYLRCGRRCGGDGGRGSAGGGGGGGACPGFWGVAPGLTPVRGRLARPETGGRKRRAGPAAGSAECGPLAEGALLNAPRRPGGGGPGGRVERW